MTPESEVSVVFELTDCALCGGLLQKKESTMFLIQYLSEKLDFSSHTVQRNLMFPFISLTNIICLDKSKLTAKI